MCYSEKGELTGDRATARPPVFMQETVGAGAQTVDEEAEMAKEFSRLIYMRKRWREQAAAERE